MSNHVVAVDLDQGVEEAFANVITFVPKLVGFLAVLIIGYFVVKAISWTVGPQALISQAQRRVRRRWPASNGSADRMVLA